MCEGQRGGAGVRLSLSPSYSAASRAGKGIAVAQPARRPRPLHRRTSILLPAARCRRGLRAPWLQEDLRARGQGPRAAGVAGLASSGLLGGGGAPQWRELQRSPRASLALMPPTSSTRGSPASRRQRSRALAAPSTSPTSRLNCGGHGQVWAVARCLRAAPGLASAPGPLWLTHARCLGGSAACLPGLHTLASRMTSAALTYASATTRSRLGPWPAAMAFGRPRCLPAQAVVIEDAGGLQRAAEESRGAWRPPVSGWHCWRRSTWRPISSAEGGASDLIHLEVGCWGPCQPLQTLHVPHMSSNMAAVAHVAAKRNVHARSLGRRRECTEQGRRQQAKCKEWRGVWCSTSPGVGRDCDWPDVEC